MKKRIACMLALMLCLSSFAALAEPPAQTRGLSISLVELNSAMMDETTRENIPALLEQLSMDMVATPEGSFSLSFGNIQLYYAQDTGLLVYLPDTLLNDAEARNEPTTDEDAVGETPPVTGVDALMNAALFESGGQGSWYRPLVSGMRIDSNLFDLLQNTFLQGLGEELGLNLGTIGGAEPASPLGGGMAPAQLFRYFREDLDAIARRMEPKLDEWRSSGPFKTLLAGLMGEASFSINSTMLNMAIRQIQKSLTQELNLLLSQTTPPDQSQSAAEAEAALPDLLQGLHFSSYYAQLYHDFLVSLHALAQDGQLSSLFGEPANLPTFSLDINAGHISLQAGEDFLLTANKQPKAEGMDRWAGQILTAGAAPIHFTLDISPQSIVLDTFNEQGGIQVSLNYSSSGWLQEWQLFTLNTRAYSLHETGALAEVRNTNAALYMDKTMLSLQFSDGSDEVLAVFTHDDTAFTADLSTTQQGHAHDPDVHIEANWAQGFTALITETTPKGEVSGARLWILPDQSNLSFGLASIERSPLTDTSETILQGSWEETPDAQSLRLQMGGTSIHFDLNTPTAGLQYATIDVSESGISLLHAALHLQERDDLQLPEPSDIQEVELEWLLGVLSR